MNTPVAFPGSPDVIVLGEALIDMVVSAGGVTEHPGGSPANVAYGLARLGIDTGFLTALGHDDRGDAIRAHLNGAGVGTVSGSRNMVATSTAKATLGEDGSASYSFDVTWPLDPMTLTHQPKLLHTGSIASFLAPGAASVRGLIEDCKAATTITYDPNIRPELLGSHQEALAIFEGLVPLTDVVKLSDEDADWLYPRQSIETTTRHLLGLGTKLVVVTQGAAGSLLETPEYQISVSGVPSVVADTIGAGDSYMAAFILGLLTKGIDGWTPDVLENVGRMASAAAAITVRRPGANPPSGNELRDFLVSPTLGASADGRGHRTF